MQKRLDSLVTEVRDHAWEYAAALVLVVVLLLGGLALLSRDGASSRSVAIADRDVASPPPSDRPQAEVISGNPEDAGLWKKEKDEADDEEKRDRDAREPEDETREAEDRQEREDTTSTRRRRTEESQKRSAGQMSAKAVSRMENSFETLELTCAKRALAYSKGNYEAAPLDALLDARGVLLDLYKSGPESRYRTSGRSGSLRDVVLDATQILLDDCELRPYFAEAMLRSIQRTDRGF